MLDSIASVYGDFGLSYGIEIGPLVRPREVSAWLRLRRMRRIMPTSIRYRAAAPIRRESGEPSVDRAISVDEIATAARISCSVFRMPAAVETLLANTRHDPRWRMWIARSGETPIAAAMSFMDQGVAWLGWDATLPAFRGHGAHNALIAARVADAYDHDCHHVTAETAVHTSARPDPSGRNYERLGFLLAYDRLTYVFIGTSAASSAFRQ